MIGSPANIAKLNSKQTFLEIEYFVYKWAIIFQYVNLNDSYTIVICIGTQHFK